MRPDLVPTACLPFEPEEARSLLWLPLAVRHKLDASELGLSLKDWQALPLAARRELLQLPAGAGFSSRILQAGGSVDARSKHGRQLTECEAARALDCGVAEAGAWLAVATPFACYALGKLSKAVAAG